MFKKLFKRKSKELNQKTTVEEKEEKGKNEELESVNVKIDPCSCDRCEKLVLSHIFDEEKMEDSENPKNKTAHVISTDTVFQSQDEEKTIKPQRNVKGVKSKKIKNCFKECPNNLTSNEKMSVRSAKSTALTEFENTKQFKDCKPVSVNCVPCKDCCAKRDNKSENKKYVDIVKNKLISQQPIMVDCDVFTKDTTWKITTDKVYDQIICESQREPSPISYTCSLSPSGVTKCCNQSCKKDMGVGVDLDTNKQQEIIICSNKMHTVDNGKVTGGSETVCCNNQSRVWDTDNDCPNTNEKSKNSYRSCCPRVCCMHSKKTIEQCIRNKNYHFKCDCAYCYKCDQQRPWSSGRKEYYPLCTIHSCYSWHEKDTEYLVPCESVSNTSIPTILQFFRYKSGVCPGTKTNHYPCYNNLPINEKASTTRDCESTRHDLNCCCLQELRTKSKTNYICRKSPSKRDCCTECASIRCCPPCAKVVSVCVGRSSANMRPTYCSKATNYSVKNRYRIKRQIKNTGAEKKIVARGTQSNCESNFYTCEHCEASNEPDMIFNPPPLLNTIQCI